MFDGDSVEGFKVASHPVFESLALVWEQLDDRTGDGLVGMRYAEEQLNVLPDAELVPMA